MIEASKYCINVIKKYFKEELMLTKEDNENFKNSVKCWIWHNGYVDNDVKVRDNWHITGKYRGFAHRDWNFKINLKLNHKIPVAFHNLKKYDFHLIMQVLSIFNHKINVIPNGLEKYTSFTINNKFYWQLSFSKFFIR